MARRIVGLTIVLLMFVCGVHGRTLYVPANGSVRDSVNAAADGDTVLVAPGTFYGMIAWPTTIGIVLMSEQGPEVTTLDGFDVNAVIRMSGNTIDSFTVIRGFTITGGSSSDGGGGIHLESGASPLITENVITGNSTIGHGGGILAVTNCDPAIRDNIISGNSADSSGGGIAAVDNSSPRILGNTISGNSSGVSGGGIALTSQCAGLLKDNHITGNSSADGAGIYQTFICAPDIIDNVISGNTTVSGSGGGIFASDFCAGTISGNVLAHDTALTSGGGLALRGFLGVLESNSIVDNVSYLSGGGIDLEASDPSMIDNVISRNWTNTFGGGVFCAQSEPVMQKNAISSNSASFGGGLYIAILALPLIGDTDSTGNDIYHNISSDGANVKNFAPLADSIESTLNFWGRTQAFQQDSTAVAATVVNLGEFTWWPMSVTPLTITREAEAAGDTIYFNECTLILNSITFNPSGDSSFSVTAWPDSPPAYSQTGRFALPKLFDVSVGSGVSDFTADLTLYYSQGEVDSTSGIQSEATMHIRQYADPNWDSCLTISRDTARNSVTCSIDAGSQFILVGTDELPTDVDDVIPGNVPGEYLLSQNYPNPFNPTTEFEYSIPVRSHVNIDIYNVLGQHVRTLVNGERPAGSYRVTWNGRNGDGAPVSTGVYLYRLTTGNAVLTRKMVFIK